MKRCPTCNSTNLKKSKKKVKCLNCGFVNTNFKEVKVKKSEMGMKHYIFDKKVLNQINNLALFQIFYNEILVLFIYHLNKTRNRYSEDTNVKIALNELSNEFQQNLMGFFEQLETKWKYINEKCVK